MLENSKWVQKNSKKQPKIPNIDRKPDKLQIKCKKMMGTTKNGNKLMGMSKKGKMIEFPKMIKLSKNGKNDGNFQKWKNTGIFQKSNKCQKLNLLGEFPVLGWIPVVD